MGAGYAGYYVVGNATAANSDELNGQSVGGGFSIAIYAGATITQENWDTSGGTGWSSGVGISLSLSWSSATITSSAYRKVSPNLNATDAAHLANEIKNGAIFSTEDCIIADPVTNGDEVATPARGSYPQ